MKKKARIIITLFILTVIFSQTSLQVHAGRKKVTGIIIPSSTIKIVQGNQKQLTYEVYPKNAKNQRVTFSIENRSIARVNSKGIVTGISEGKTKLTVGATDGSRVKQTIDIIVAKPANDIKKVAHRGFVLEAPENTIASFVAAGEKGFWGLEFDIHATQDNRLVVMHDKDIVRTTNGSGNVSDFNLGQLRRFRINSGTNIKKYPKQKVPTLEETLKICKEYSMVPIIELKGVNRNQIKVLLNTIEKYDMLDSAVIITFDQSMLEYIRGISPYIQLQWLEYDLSPAHINWCAERNIDIASKFKSVTKTKVDFAHRNQIKVNTWTILNRSVYKTMAACNVDYMTMDFY